MNVQRVERVADLVGYACCQQCQRIQPFRLNGLLGCPPALGNIAQDHDVSDLGRRSWSHGPVARILFDASQRRGDSASFTMLDNERHDVKVDEAILRIKNFHVMADWPATLRQRFPIETSDSFVERFANSIRRLQSKQATSRIV